MYIVSSPKGLIESDLLENLNEPCVLEDTSWIKPGKSFWDWRNHGAVYDGFTYNLDNESMKRYIDYASKYNVQYLLIDGGWYGNPNIDESDPIKFIDDIDVPKLVKYAEVHGVGIWLYLDDRGLKLYDMDRTLSTYKKWGIKGIKHGFIKSKGQEGVEFTRHVVKKCAEYELMYVPHEPIRPWGLHITYPNLLSCEFVGAQFDGPEREGVTPTHLCSIPFTNNLAAPLDRSPGMFDLNRAKQRHRIHREPLSTICSQLAQCIIIQTGFLSLLDNPDAYNGKEDLAEFIKVLPEMNWDDTVCVNGEIGKFVTIARQYNSEWYVGCQNNEEARIIEVPFNFLEKGTRYEITLYKDEADAHYILNREAYVIEHGIINRDDTMNIRMASGGGCAMWIRKEKEQ